MDCNRINFVSVDTISDIFLNIQQFFFLPGNFIFSMLDSNPKVQYFFEINCFTDHNITIGFLSFLIWAFIFFFLISKLD